ncbi:MAG: DoxX family protein [Candidatus Acidiferrales bacterium]
MLTAYVVVTIIAAIANSYAPANDFIRPKWLLANMTKLGVHESWLTKLGLLKAAGAVGVLAGIRVPLIGIAAAVGLVLFFVGAIITHLRSRNHSPVGR